MEQNKLNKFDIDLYVKQRMEEILNKQKSICFNKSRCDAPTSPTPRARTVEESIITSVVNNRYYARQ